MRAAKFRAHLGKVQFVEGVQEPQTGEHELLIRPRCGGICGSDLHAAALGIFTDGVTIGHEFAGTIEHVGPGVTGFSVGDRVVVNPNYNPCGKCFGCQAGQYNMCEQLLNEGIGQAVDGGFADLVKVPARTAFKLPDNLSFEQAAFVEPLATAIRAVRRAGLKLGDKALVIGAGPIGLLIVACLLRAGAAEVAVAEISALRRKKALEIGATVAFDPRSDDAALLSQNDAPAFVFECAGVPDAFALATRAVRKRGAIIFVAIPPQCVPFDVTACILKEVAAIPSFAYVEDFEISIDLLSRGFFDVAPLVSHRLPIADVGKGFEILQDSNDGIKVLIEI